MDFKGFFGNWFVRNVIAACVVVLALVFVANFFSQDWNSSWSGDRSA